MTYACSLRRQEGTRAITTNLSIEMLGAAQPGDWVEAEVDVMRAGSRVIFVNAFIRRGTERIARASATFQIVPRPGDPAASR
jgi:acyl-coenzyme A thioesterase PaaI-like protein